MSTNVRSLFPSIKQPLSLQMNRPISIRDNFCKDKINNQSHKNISATLNAFLLKAKQKLPLLRQGTLDNLKEDYNHNSSMIKTTASTISSLSSLHYTENVNINSNFCKVNDNKALNSKILRERSRSGKKDKLNESLIKMKTFSSSNKKNNDINNNNNKENENMPKEFNLNILDHKNDISKCNDPQNNFIGVIFDKENQIKKNPTMRTIKDIKDDYMQTKRASESIQTNISNETNKQIKEITNQFNLLLPNRDIRAQIQNPNEKANTLRDNINNINLVLFTANYENLNINRTKANDSNFSQKEYRQLLNTYTMLEYGQSILNDFFDKEETINSCLSNHEITPNMRMKMVDWLVEVFYKIKSSNNTFFTTISIMDRYFKKTQEKYKPNDLLLIGLTSIFIASKFCEIYPIKLNTLIEKIGHKSFTKDDVLLMENKIMKDIEYNVLKPTILDFSTFYFQELFHLFENNFNVKNKVLGDYLKDFIEHLNIKAIFDNQFFEKCNILSKYTDNMKNFLQAIINYLLMMCCLDYELSSEKPSLVSAAVLLVAMKICEEVNKEQYASEYFIEKLEKISRQNQYNIMTLSSKILYNVQHYEVVYKDMNNLYNMQFNTINQIIQTK